MLMTNRPIVSYREAARRVREGEGALTIASLAREMGMSEESLRYQLCRSKTMQWLYGALGLVTLSKQEVGRVRPARARAAFRVACAEIWEDTQGPPAPDLLAEKLDKSAASIRAFIQRNKELKREWHIVSDGGRRCWNSACTIVRRGDRVTPSALHDETTLSAQSIKKIVAHDRWLKSEIGYCEE